jgi:ketosteroid isomerase-like protein
MTRDEIIAIVTDALARFETDFRDPEKALEPFTEDLVWWIAGSAKTSGTMDRAGMLAMFTGLPSYTDSGMRLTPKSWVVEGNKAAVEGESWMQLKDGRVYTNLYHWLFELRDDGKIARVREYLDTALVEELVGKA